jgi:hypothetical protein
MMLQVDPMMFSLDHTQIRLQWKIIPRRPLIVLKTLLNLGFRFTILQNNISRMNLVYDTKERCF